MQQEINDIIDKHLPAQVGETLRKRLDQATKAEKDANYLSTRVTDLAREVESLKTQIKTQAEIESKLAEITRREAAVREKEVVQGILQEKLSGAEARIRDVKELVALVFQNNRFKYREFGNVPMPSGQYGTSSSYRDMTTEGEG